MRKAERKNIEYRYVRNDITSNCNLRCKFCVHDWKNIKPTHNMDVSTFSKIVPLLPMVQDEGFHFSCRFEPIINPQLPALLDAIPESCKNKVFLTTNLSRPLSEDFIQKLTRSHLHHINISIETFNPDTYKNLCVGGNFELFYNNLVRLVTAFRASDHPPKIRFITMILKENYDELIDIAVRCHTDFFADNHEFRTPYYYSLAVFDPTWAKDQMLSRGQLDILVSRLKELPFATCWSTESDDQALSELTRSNGNNLKDYDIYAIRDTPVPVSTFKDMSANEDFYDLRIESDGTVYFYGTREKYAIHEIDYPYDFFLKKLNYLFTLETSRFERIQCRNNNGKKSLESQIYIDTFYDLGSFLLITGWVVIENSDCNNFTKILMINNTNETFWYPVDTILRPDVMEHFKNPCFLHSGFKCIIKKSDIEGNSFTFRILFTPKSFVSSLKTVYFAEYSETLAF